MSKTPTRNQFHAGDFISENAVRGANARHRSATDAERIGADARPARVAGSKRTRPPLRRWSVAELIARSVPPRPVS